MKSSLAGLAAITLAALSGCTQGTPGGPGTTSTTANKPAYGQADDTFNLSAPMTSTSLQQGNTMETTVGIKRAKNFEEDVTLKFADVPKGVTVEPASPVIKHGDSDAKITFKAGDEAPLGDFKVKVTGHPTKGGDAQIDFALTIAAKDSFTLSVPLLSTSLKQGETKTVAIGIKRDKSFDQDVALKFGEMPTGVTLGPDAPVIKRGDTEAQITLTGADDAALGDFAIKVTGHPAKGADASNELKLTVVKEQSTESEHVGSDVMSMGSIFSWIVCGLLVGMCARFLVPGRQSMSLLMTTALGIVGALVGGFLYSLFQGASATPFSLATHNWYGWIVSILGAMLLVWMYPFIYPRKWYQ